MAYQNRDNRSPGRRNFGRNNGGGFGGGNKGPTTMHRAVCDECGNQCEVPFKPMGNRPVLCSNCFGGSKGGSENRGNRRDSRSFEKPRFSEKRMYSAVCDGCDNDCEVPFRPTGDKPVYCSNCFGGGEKKETSFKTPNRNNNNEMLEAKLDELNRKMDTLLRMLAPVVTPNSVKEKEDKKSNEDKKRVSPESKVTEKKVIQKKGTAKKAAKEKAATVKTPKKTVKKAAPKKKTSTKSKKK